VQRRMRRRAITVFPEAKLYARNYRMPKLGRAKLVRDNGPIDTVGYRD